MREVNTEIEISAPPAEVWRVLVGFDRYAEWNPFIPELRGDASEGSRLHVRIAPEGEKGMVFKPVLLRVDEPRELRWLGKLLVSGLFDGEHVFELEDLGGRTRLLHREMFRGILVPLFWNKMAPSTRRGFVMMNEALRRRVEGAPSDRQES